MKHIDPVYLSLTAAYVAFLTTIVVLADLGWAPWVFSASKLVSWGDKPSHLLGIYLFGLLALWNLRQKASRDRRESPVQRDYIARS